MTDIRASIETIKEKIRTASWKSGRSESDIRLIGATKRVDVARIRVAMECGLVDFGENYIQEAREKIEGFGDGATWHMIGHIQSNKIKFIPGLFDWVHSVDRWETLEALDRYGKSLSVLFEVNLAGEETKHGTDTDGVRRIFEKVHRLRSVKPAGLMTMPPYSENPEDSRHHFQTLRNILETINKEFGLTMKELSMGMSGDFEVAIEEGATMVRVGTAIFGERQ